MTTTTKERQELLTAALDYTASMKGKARDRALFDFLAGASTALYGPHECPPWLWIIGVRGGTRLREVQDQLAQLAKHPQGEERQWPERAAEDDDTPEHIVEAMNAALLKKA